MWRRAGTVRRGRMKGVRIDSAKIRYPYSMMLPAAAAVAMTTVWLRSSGNTAASWLPMVPAGFVAWTLLEYLLHRFALHGIEPFRRWHLEHHRDPAKPLQTPVLFSLILAGAFVSLPFALPLHAHAPTLFAVGLCIGQVSQEIVHHRLHRTDSPSNRWLAARWREHGYHHEVDRDAAFGTCTGFWDRVFGTSPRRDRRIS